MAGKSVVMKPMYIHVHIYKNSKTGLEILICGNKMKRREINNFIKYTND